MKNKSKSMKSSTKKLNICLLLLNPFDPNFPSRPAVTEIYGKYLPSFGHKVTGITPFTESGKGVQEDFFNDIHVYTIPRPMDSSLPLKIFNQYIEILNDNLESCKPGEIGQVYVTTLNN